MITGQRTDTGVHSVHNSKARFAGSRRYLRRGRDDGFTLIEMVIVTAIMPLIIGALAVGIVSVFKLQSGVANRLGDSADSQQISSVFSNDIAGAQYVTSDALTTPQCGVLTGTMLLKIDTNSNRQNGTAPVIVYELSQNTSGNALAYNLVRLSCPGETSSTPSSITTLAYDVSTGPKVAINCPGGTCPSDPTTGWLGADQVSDITFDLQGQRSGYNYTLAASPVGNVTSSSGGSPQSPSAQTTCNTADPNSGSLSANLCFVDFTQLGTNPALWAQATASGGCAAMSVSIGTTGTLFFCINISVTGSGAYLAPTAVPNYNKAFLGGCYPYGACVAPFYTGIAGEPALWLNAKGSNATATITVTGIHVNLLNGQAATGWQFLSADAESTDANDAEYINWTTPAATPLTAICNGESWDYCTSPDPKGNLDLWGNACLDDQAQVGLVQTLTTGVNGQSEIQCLANLSGNSEAAVQKSGTAMVEAVAPTQMTIKMGTNGGLQAITLGLLISGLS